MVTGIFFFSHNVFYPSHIKSQFLNHIFICRLQILSIWIGPILLFGIELIQIEKINVGQNLKIVTERVEDVFGKGENAGQQHFFLYPKCFQTASFHGVWKVGLCDKFLIPIPYKTILFLQLKESFTIFEKEKTLVACIFSDDVSTLLMFSLQLSCLHYCSTMGQCQRNFREIFISKQRDIYHIFAYFLFLARSCRGYIHQPK